MRRPNHKVDKYRVNHLTLGESPAGANWGCFEIPFKGAALSVISSGSPGHEHWEHVSVSLPDRCPTWPEMCFVKNLFWAADETVLQFHPRRDRCVNQYEFCLHLWRQAGKYFELPPEV